MMAGKEKMEAAISAIQYAQTELEEIISEWRVSKLKFRDTTGHTNDGGICLKAESEPP